MTQTQKRGHVEQRREVGRKEEGGRKEEEKRGSREERNERKRLGGGPLVLTPSQPESAERSSRSGFVSLPVLCPESSGAK